MMSRAGRGTLGLKVGLGKGAGMKHLEQPSARATLGEERVLEDQAVLRLHRAAVADGLLLEVGDHLVGYVADVELTHHVTNASLSLS